jgi:glycine cleavage system aminomethyltransferase T
MDSVQMSIVYAYLPIDFTKVGTELEIEFFGERIPAIVERSPLYDPKGEKIKA